ncbi:MAG: CDP-glucose 4,6-dehydratase [Anaerolineae bacterium]|nr:CDP-glucose 4,6-dehydratase [Anaerolineae bacterium]
MELTLPFANVYDGLPVLVTGHTGFKGSWLSIWLRELGAEVTGFSLPELPTVPGNFEVCRLVEKVMDVRGDVRDLEAVRAVIASHQPRLIFHLAAQPLVLAAYRQPKETFDTNVSGTVNVLEAVRKADGVGAVVCVTTDKVYENRDWVWGYRENDRLGGHDPYSASKAMAELAIAAYRTSYFAHDGPAVASARAGNVIGGGDFAADRLLPDTMRALMAGEPVRVRNPEHVRPWQHVLESLSGYLWLGARLLRDGATYAGAWNFAPRESRGVTTREVVEKALALWGGGAWKPAAGAQREKETALLRLNWDKAANHLGWRPLYDWDQALAATVDWFRVYHQRQQDDAGQLDMYDVCLSQIDNYTARAAASGFPWAQ